jgi:hypothetical protein
MSGKYPALGFDPAPGSVGTITTLADNLGTVAKELSEAYHELSTVGRSDGFWRDWRRVCELALGVFETVEWQPLDQVELQ